MSTPSSPDQQAGLPSPPDAASIKPLRLLIPFNTPALYGMERGVIETIGGLRPWVEPHFVLTQTAKRNNLPVYRAILEGGFSHSFFSDRGHWPKIAFPKSPVELARILHAVVVGNLDVLRASKGQDALYLPGIHYQMYALLAALAIRRRGGPVIYHFHDMPAQGPWGRVFDSLSGLLTHVVHNTTLSQGWAFRRHPYLEQRVRNAVIPYICLVRRGQPNQVLNTELQSTRSLVYVGQVEYHKGIDLLLESIDLIREIYPNLHIHILGSVGSREFKARFEELLARPGLGERCTYWGYREDVHAFVAAAYAYVQPTRPSVCNESFGRGAVEAMALGVPTICLESGSLQEIVRDGKTGLICREETPEALAATLRRLLDSPTLQDEMSRACLAEYEATYTPERVRQQWLDFLRPERSRSGLEPIPKP